MLFLHQFKDFMIIILMAAAVLSGIMGELTDTTIILVIIFLNAIVGFDALAANTTGIDNIALGTGALNVNSTGYSNI